MSKRSPFRYFKTSPEIIRLAVMLYNRFPLSLRNVEDLLHERGIEMLRALGRSPQEFDASKRFVIAGATLGFLVWFFGFMVVGGEWFLMWQSGTWNGQTAAFQFYMSMLAVLIFVNQPERA